MAIAYSWQERVSILQTQNINYAVVCGWPLFLPASSIELDITASNPLRYHHAPLPILTSTTPYHPPFRTHLLDVTVIAGPSARNSARNMNPPSPYNVYVARWNPRSNSYVENTVVFDSDQEFRIVIATKSLERRYYAFTYDRANGGSAIIKCDIPHSNSASINHYLILIGEGHLSDSPDEVFEFENLQRQVGRRKPINSDITFVEAAFQVTGVGRSLLWEECRAQVDIARTQGHRISRPIYIPQYEHLYRRAM
ncbi:hypothetical protein DFJ43DRAFT_748947 [Lentinula guzmanii]|uniref:Uncharacterized protein n=1 Tax=Lentinula guzmanii TaxID=2804957 RepID=A0AA38MW88_9AGAR|nr:hypothetical protein DFJ43DRAFT_748947 [Lentinula guzmanii]